MGMIFLLCIQLIKHGLDGHDIFKKIVIRQRAEHVPYGRMHFLHQRRGRMRHGQQDIAQGCHPPTSVSGKTDGEQSLSASRLQGPNHIGTVP